MNKLIAVLIGLGLIAVLVPSSAFAVAFTSTDTLYSCGSSDGTDIDVHLRDKLTGVSISSNSWSISGLSGIQGCFGLAQNPNDFQWYAIIESESSRFLASVDPSDGTGTLIGSINGTVNSLAISNDGTFYTARDTLAEDDLLSINKSTGDAVILCDMDLNGFTPFDEVNRIAWDFDRDIMVVAHNPDDRNNFFEISEMTSFGSGAGTSCGINRIVSALAPANINPLQTNYNQTFSWTYHTEDNLLYAYHKDAFPTGNEYYVTHNSFPEGKSNIPSFDTNILNAVPLSNATSLKTLSPIDSFTLGLAFAFLQPDSTPPVISTTVSEPIPIVQNSVFDELQFVTCIDDFDGDITNTMSPEIQIDTTIVGVQTQDYGCQDIATNSANETFEYIIQRQSSGSGGGGSSSSGTAFSGQSTVLQTLDDVPPLLQFSPSEDRQADPRGFSFADLFANLFDNRLGVDGEKVTTPASTPASQSQGATTAPSQRPNPITEFLTNLFNSFFGFILPSVFAVDDIDDPVLDNNNYFISVVDSLEITDSVIMIKN